MSGPFRGRTTEPAVRCASHAAPGKAVSPRPGGCFAPTGWGPLRASRAEPVGKRPDDDERKGKKVRHRILYLFAAAAAAPIMAAASAAQSTSGQDLTPDGRGAYIAIAGATDLFSIQSAEKMLEKSRRPEVRAFAQTMLTEHRASMERLGALARAVGMSDLMPPGMLPMHWDMLRDLDDASSSRIDEEYIEQQVEAHEVAVELHRNFAANGHGPRGRAYAESMLPTATQHLEQARQLDR